MPLSRFTTCLLLISCFTVQLALAQASLRVRQTAAPLRTDGRLDEPAWRLADSATQFRAIYLADSGYAKAQTRVRILRDEQFLYIGAELFQPDSSGKYVVSSLMRDFPFYQNDLFWVVLNPSNDRSNGYAFNLSAAGVQHELQIYNGDAFNASWDQKWYAEVSHQPGKWVAEIAIPFRSLRYKAEQAEWRVNFGRNDNRLNEYSAWQFIPRNLAIGHLTCTVPLLFDEAPRRQASNVSWIPSLTTTVQQDHQHGKNTRIRLTPSLDVKVPVTSTLNLDLTVNPDYSQVEADVTQANLTRFELYFPERRQFFIENNDLFTNYGNDAWFTSDSRPFYTRRIGLQFNARSQAYESVPIWGGARLSGQLNKNLRLGVLTMQSAQQKHSYPTEQGERTQYLPSQNYTVGVVQRQVFGRSNISAIFVNRQAFGTDSTTGVRYNPNDYNRVVGLDYNLLTNDGKWLGKFYHHRSFTSGVARRGYAPEQNSHGSFLQYTTRCVQAFVGHTYVGRDYNPEVGFVPRTNFLNFRSSFRYFLYPRKESSVLNRFYPTAFYSVYYHPQHDLTDRSLVLSTTARFKNRSVVMLLLNNDYTKMLADFDPSRARGTPLRAGTAYAYSYLVGSYQSDNTRPVFTTLETNAGQYFNGRRYSLFASLSYKAQPWGIFSLNTRYTSIQLPTPHSSNGIWVGGPRADISFSRTLFLTMLTQYNSLSQNLNVFAKLQWRFRPLSDLYLVYQDQYDAEYPSINLNSRNMASKLTYWF